MRYAVYYAPPPDHPLWRAGCAWFGRDPSAAADTREPPRPHVREPWRYGFHATLKPPMRLSPGHDESSLHEAIAVLARRTPRLEMPSLSVQWLGDFLALRPTQALPQDHPLQRLADACVERLDPWRAPPTPEELQRREQAVLDDEQRALLSRWGYPHVHRHWRLHFTLTDSLPQRDELRADLQQQAEQHFGASLAVPLVCDAVCLYLEPAPGAPFMLARRYPFG